jgi:uncharacterized membrane protein
MSSVTTSIDVDLPVSTVYNQWTQFEEFPQFMEGVEKVTQRDDTHLRWVAEIAGKTKEWEAEITEQEPDQRIAWTAREGAFNAGVVTFHPLEDQRTRVTLQMEFEPETFTERVGDAVGIVQRQVEGDLERFKEFIEARGRETGGWRGEIGAN